MALAPTIEQHDLPERLFADLIDAFVQDQTVKRYATWDQLLDYCTRSANPVGRLVLRLYGERSDTCDELADATCTALQLTNFWQDVRRDVLERDRVYIPAEVAQEHGLELETMVRMTRLDEAVRCQACGSAALGHAGLGAVVSGGTSGGTSGGVSGGVSGGGGISGGGGGGGGLGELMPAYRATLHALVKRTWPLFEEGRDLWPRVDGRFRGDLKLFTLGGEAVLRRIERQRYDTWSQRPRISKLSKAGLVLRVAVGRLWG